MQRSWIASAGIGLGLTFALAGCASVKDSGPATPPVAETLSTSDLRVTAVAEIRAKAAAAEAADARDYPPIFGTRASGSEAKTAAELAAIERELTALGQKQRGASAPGEVARLRRRAQDLERLRDALRGTMKNEGAAISPPS